ncbi:tRNA(Thr) (cytosine(32)-N(3))-methyltransferase [Penicillium chermesinum]|uniref:tRNA N(3)-methylcytidine methyltransferase n=1 Tax=Penicillium chermesinum TaxID=63820 RepID=A0A9W9TJX2_9EURO|nr:tRNA(Thr) (cytosine(32)-N(3))-methyltransferase [Penicillium chermesinum]KAJ5225557.1 tRNA(Thr) (cytosine(32)-N(3))-methyltransferase [Penicillium chermesinum]KAJ6161223.1 tRNA(Thr) (cytosine(32)-N(3))-methyltransferase [Penicillium chermesinum]
MSEEQTIREVMEKVQPPQLPPHRSHDPSNNLKRSDPFQFGSRYLEQGDNVFEFNAWDHVEPDDEFKEFAETQYEKQRAAPVSDFDKNRFNNDPAKWWNLFYKNNTANFFKDRKWLRQEFPVLDEVTKKGAGRQVVLEVGAGAGNTAFPLIRNNENEELMVHACDFSKYAVQVMRESEYYNPKYMVADVWDVAAERTETEDSLPPGLTDGSVDVVILIFIFSALNPKQWDRALHNIHRLLKPGGRVLFRDYGRGDLAQVRFKKGRYMEENFYVRGDGTRVYFFDKEELVNIWSRWTPEKGLQLGSGDEPSETQPADANAPFEVVHMGVDRRLLVNRSSKVKMYRCWMQGHFRKREGPAAIGQDDA